MMEHKHLQNKYNYNSMYFTDWEDEICFIYVYYSILVSSTALLLTKKLKNNLKS